jgi:hypothetical protein
VYEGQLPTTKTVLYTVPEDAVAYVKQISIYNTNAAAQTVKFYVKPGATSRTWRRYSLNQDESAELLDQNQVLMLDEGDSIEAETTTASAVDCFIVAVVEA